MIRTLINTVRKPSLPWQEPKLLLTVQRSFRRTVHTRSSRSAAQTETISKEDLGLIETFVPPKKSVLGLLATPTLLLKTIYYRLIVNNMHLRSFRKSIRPDSLSLPMLIVHASELRNALKKAAAEKDIKKIRILCGVKMQSRLIRDIKNRKPIKMTEEWFGHEHGPVRATSRVQLVSFVQQPVDSERKQNYVQAIVRFYKDNIIEDVVLSSKTWIRPITWTIEQIR